MADRRTCPRCHSGLPDQSPDGPCPGCSWRAGLDRDASTLSFAAGDVTVDMPGSQSVMGTIAAVAGGPAPRVLLRDTDHGPEAPIHRPGSTEMPAPVGRAPRLRLLGEIARGGMGAVLKGRDEDLGRDLAVKVLLEAHRDNPGLVRRFVEEAQIGGQLQHPGIVPIYELGTFADRRPYFAMKLVKGQTFAEILAARKGPADGLPRFLDIFESVCQTVAYAHARGVIHRDLKPSNIMVGGFGEVQVMDWGLAKVLARGGVADDAVAGKRPDRESAVATARSGGDTDTDLSQAGSVMGTPAYMAPEQGRGEVDRIDERADVFALGSILCEILTGHPAFVGRTVREIHRKAVLGETDDAKARLDASGLDAGLIALAKDCLEIEPDHRPRNAQAVSERMTAHLAGVQERLRTAERERAVAEARAVEERRKRRWQLGLAASVAAFLLLGGVGLACFVAILDGKNDELTAANGALDQQRLRAEDREGQAIDAVKRFRDAVADNPELKNNPELGTLRKTLLKEPVAFFRSLRQRLQSDGDTRPESLARLASASFELAELADEIGDKGDAIASHREALSIRQGLLDAQPGSTLRRSELAASQDSLGVVLLETGHPAEARATLEAALANWKALTEASPADDGYRDELAKSHHNLASLFDATGMPTEARREFEAARGHWQAQVDAHPEVADYRSGLARVLVDYGVLLFSAGKVDEALQVNRQALAAWKGLAQAHPTDDRYQYELAKSHTVLGGLLLPAKQAAESRAEHEAALPIWEALASAHPTVTQYRYELARGHALLGATLLVSHDLAAARTQLEAALKHWRPLADAHPEVPDYALELGNTLTNLAASDLDDRRYAPARDRLRESIAWQRKALERNPGNPNYRHSLFTSYTNLLRAAKELDDIPLQVEAQRGLAEMNLGDPRYARIDRRLDAVLKGEPPKDLPERASLARRAYNCGRYSDAVKVWSDAQAAEPGLGASRSDQYLYDAACCALLAASGRDLAGPQPDDATRSKLRGQALAWLGAELASWSKSFESGDAEDRSSVVTTLHHWKTDADLASVRDPAPLAVAERAPWQALWAEVDRLIDRASNSP